MAIPRYLIDVLTRHQVLLERLKAGEVESVDQLLNRLDAAVRQKLASANTPMEAMSRAELDRLVEEVVQEKERLGAIWKAQFEEHLKELAAQEASVSAEAMARAATAARVSPISDLAAWQYARLYPVQSAGQLLSPFISNWTEKTLSNVEGLLRKAHDQGWTNDQTVRALRGTKANNFKDGLLPNLKRSLDTLVRTAMQHVSNAARAATLEANADIVTGYMWISTLDRATCRTCAALDGQVFKPGKGPRPPHHPACRCTIVAMFDDAVKILGSGRRASKGAEGGAQVPATETYFSWLKKQPVDFQDEVLGPTRGLLLRNGGLTADEFARLNLGRDFKPLTLEAMKKLAPKVFDKAGIGDESIPTTDDARLDGDLPGHAFRGNQYTEGAAAWYAVDRNTALNKLYGPISEWIHYPETQGKTPVLQAYEALSPAEKAALDADVAAAFRGAHDSDTVVAYRFKNRPRHMGGMSLTTKKPDYLAPDQYDAFTVKASDVLAHWAEKDLPLGNRTFGHEKEIILKPGANPPRLGASSRNDAIARVESLAVRALGIPKVHLGDVPAVAVRVVEGLVAARARGDALPQVVTSVARADGQPVAVRYSGALAIMEVNPAAPAWRADAEPGWLSSDSPHHAVTHALAQVALGAHGSAALAARTLDEDEREVAITVSRIAATDAAEFIGEVHAGLAAGKRYDPEVEGLYLRLTADWAEDQPRDENGRWVYAGGAGITGVEEVPLPPGERTGAAKTMEHTDALIRALGGLHGEGSDYDARAEDLVRQEKAIIEPFREEQLDYRTALPDDQFQATDRYQTDSADLNLFLRRGEEPQKMTREQVLADAALLDRVIGSAPVVAKDGSMTVWRGATVSLAARLSRGSEFTDHGFTSTAVSASLSAIFAKYYQAFTPNSAVAVFKVNLPRGTRGLFLGARVGDIDDDYETEIVLARGGRYHVKRILKSGPCYGVEVDYLGPAEKRGDARLDAIEVAPSSRDDRFVWAEADVEVHGQRARADAFDPSQPRDEKGRWVDVPGTDVRFPRSGEKPPKWMYEEAVPAAKAMFLEYWADTHHNGWDWRLGRYVPTHYPDRNKGALLDLKPMGDAWSQNGKPVVLVEWLMALNQGEKLGEGSRAMAYVTRLADKHGVALRLQAGTSRSGYGMKTLAKTVLIRFYKKFGFEVIGRKGSNQMVRMPKEARADFDPDQPRDERGRWTETGAETVAYQGGPARGVREWNDRFIGSGQGAASYGWGHYFAEEPKVANSYFVNETDHAVTYKGEAIERTGSAYGDVAADVAERIDEGKTPAQALDEHRAWLRGILGKLDEPAPAGSDAKEREKLRAEAASALTESAAMRPEDFAVRAGAIYEVRLPRKEALLDWDAPLSEQPRIVERLVAAGLATVHDGRIRVGEHEGPIDQFTGQDVYDAGRLEVQRRANEMGISRADAAKYASKTLAKAGIPGHRYLDGQSREKVEYIGKVPYPLVSAVPGTDPVSLVARQLANSPREGLKGAVAWMQHTSRIGVETAHENLAKAERGVKEDPGIYSQQDVDGAKRAIEWAEARAAWWKARTPADFQRTGTRNVVVYEPKQVRFVSEFHAFDDLLAAIKHRVRADSPEESRIAQIVAAIPDDVVQALASYHRWADVPPRLAQAVLRAIVESGKREDFDPEQPRDENGRWTEAFQGSPARGVREWNDRFVGSGQGAATFGWGHYFAEEPKVANSYFDDLRGGNRVTYKGSGVSEAGSFSEAGWAVAMAAQEMSHGGASAEEGIRAAQRQAEFIAERYPGVQLAADRVAEARALRPQDFAIEPAGAIYQVRLPSKETLLDWDEPYDKQPFAVRKALARAGVEVRFGEKFSAGKGTVFVGDRRVGSVDGAATGQKIYAALSNELRGAQAASKVLAKAGIPGLRYLDEHSRWSIREEDSKTPYRLVLGGGRLGGNYETREEAEQAAEEQATRNLVIFDPEKVKFQAEFSDYDGLLAALKKRMRRDAAVDPIVAIIAALPAEVAKALAAYNSWAAVPPRLAQAVLRAVVDAGLAKPAARQDAFDPNQPRDENGRWSEFPTLYHVTYARNLDSIREKGLLPGYRSSFQNVTAKKDQLYFTNERGVHSWSQFFSSDPMLLRTSAFRRKEIERDPEGNLSGFDNEPGLESYRTMPDWVKEQGAPPEELEVWTGSGWKPVRDATVKEVRAGAQSLWDKSWRTTVRQDFDADQPRDAHGRWTEAGAGEATEAVIAGGDDRMGAARLAAEGTCDRLGFPTARLRVSDEERTFQLNGKTLRYAGMADLKTGEITIYPKVITPGSTPLVTVHEIAHMEFQGAMDRLRAESEAVGRLLANPPEGVEADYGSAVRAADAMGLTNEEGYAWAREHSLMRANGEWTERGLRELERVAPLQHALEKEFPGASGQPIEKLSKEDGVTDYSREWWEAWHKREADTDQALHETFAEISMRVAKGEKLTEVAKPSWRKFFRVMKKAGQAALGTKGVQL